MYKIKVHFREPGARSPFPGSVTVCSDNKGVFSQNGTCGQFEVVNSDNSKLYMFYESDISYIEVSQNESIPD